MDSFNHDLYVSCSVQQLKEKKKKGRLSSVLCSGVNCDQTI